MYRIATCILAVLVSATATMAQDRTPSTSGAVAYIISPADGDSVSNPVIVQFGLEGMGVERAGVEKEGTGHHHLIIDAEPPAMDEPIPADKNYIHFGGGQTEVELELPPGEHTLQLLLGDHNHIPHDPPVLSEQITITVE